MDNSTKLMLFQQEKDEFEHPFHIKVTITTFTILISLSMLIIYRRLFKFFTRPNKRILDEMVHFQILVQVITVVPTFIFFNIIIWAKVPKLYVTELGCYLGPYIFSFNAPYMGTHSFFISLYRYICIIQPHLLVRFNISPEVCKLLKLSL